jgi:hypothetical protein
MPKKKPCVKKRIEIDPLYVKQIAEPTKPSAPIIPPNRPIFMHPKKSTKKLEKNAVKNVMPNEKEP